MTVLFCIIAGGAAFALVDGYWRFVRVPRLRETNQRLESELAERCASLSRQLRASEECFDWYADKTRDIVYRMSVPEGAYTYINRAAMEYHKYSREEFTANPMLIVKMLHPDYHEIFASEWASIIAGKGCAPERDFRIYNKEGELRWLHHDTRIVCDEDNRPVAVEGLVVDITDKKRTENALRDSEANLRRAQEVAQLGIWRLDTESGNVELSAQAYKVFGIEEGTRVTTERFWRMVHPGDRDAVDAAWKASLDGAPFDLEYRVGTSSEEGERWVHSRAELEYGEDGAVRGAVGIIRNITGRKQLESQLLQAQKMEAIGTLAGGIAHDFNNVLSVIMGYTEIVSSKLKDHAEYASDLKHVWDATERARNLVSQIVTFSRKVEPQRAPVSLGREITRIQEIWKRILPRAVQIEGCAADDLKLVSADANQLDQVFMNLATNAVDAMRGSGRLTVSAENATVTDYQCRRCGEIVNGEMVRITVSDTGCGIAPENMDRIFETFYTTKDVGQGTGLGLSSVLGIIERHGGHIECQSVLGKGTDFHIYLPALAADEVPSRESESRPYRLPEGNETILLVDDEEDVLEINDAFLSAAGYKVLTAGNGEDALALYREEKLLVDLIVTDLNMPGMGVDRYMQGIVDINPQAKILAISGYFSAAEASRRLPPHVACFLGKPYCRADLLRAVRKVLDGAGA